ncbi:MAG: methyltransferase [Salaquimonas sp.]
MTSSHLNKDEFIRANTAVCAPPHVPEISLYLADETYDLWNKTEEELEAIGLPPPFWAFAWAGGQGLARYILDDAHIVKNKSVLDIASGSGLVAIAAKLSGAKHVVANDIDPFCASAIKLNASLNQSELEISLINLLENNQQMMDRFDVILAGDVFYDQEMTGRIWPFLQKVANSGKLVLVGDPGRSYLPKTGLEKIISYDVPVTRILEDSEIKHTSVWRVE